MNFKRSFYYLETNALINIKSSSFYKIQSNQIYTSSFAIMEMLKSTNINNYNHRKKRLKLILKTVENIDWYTPIEKLQLMYKVININEDNRYSKYLKSFVMKFIDSKSYEELNESLENRFDIKIEEIDKTYYYLNELIKHFIKNNEFINDIQKIFVCPECFFAINVQEILQKTNDLTNEELYQKILYSYDGTCNVFFDCCKYYFYEYSNKIPNKNDLVDLMHSIYLTNKACYMITNDKKLTRICKKGGKINTMIVKDFEETFNNNIGT